MKIIIVGCGKVGQTIAKALVKENHDVVIIDKNEEIVSKTVEAVDCIGLTGNGTIQSVLLEAGINTCDFLIASTDSDEINILTCLIARKTSMCKTVARIRNPEYADQISYIMNELDISMTINPEMATATEITRILRYSQSIASDSFFKGRLNLLKVEVKEDSLLVGKKLYEVPRDFQCNVLICVIERGDEVIVPSGMASIQKNDIITFIADHQNAISFFSHVGYEYKKLDSYMIVGGGKIAKYLLKNLKSVNSKSEVKIIDSDKRICESFANEYDDVSIVCGDATDKKLLEEEGINTVDAFISLTGIDEQNIVLSLFAKKSGKAKVITKINRINFVESLKELEIGSIVNPERVAANIIVSHVRASLNTLGSNIETLYKICDEKVEALGFKVREKSIVTNIKLKDMNIKKNVLVAGIYRYNKIIIPKGNDEIMVGDSVVVISKGHTFKDITDILKKDEP